MILDFTEVNSHTMGIYLSSSMGHRALWPIELSSSLALWAIELERDIFATDNKHSSHKAKDY